MRITIGKRITSKLTITIRRKKQIESRRITLLVQNPTGSRLASPVAMSNDRIEADVYRSADREPGPMELPVLLEPTPTGGFRARSGDPLNLTAEGDSPAAALDRLRDLIALRIADGSQLTTLRVPDAGTATIHPGAGMYEGDPLFDPWREEFEAYRQNIEDDPDIP